MIATEPRQEPTGPIDRPPLVALDLEDSPEGLGDRIANLTLVEAVELARYLATQLRSNDHA
jgi:hypothetical protein